MYDSNSTTENIAGSIDVAGFFLPYEAVVHYYVMFWIIDIIGITGNCMIITAVAFSQKLQTPTNVFVTSLAVTDLFTCLVSALGYIAIPSLPLTKLSIICQVGLWLMHLLELVCTH